MPELPEVETVRTGLENAIKGAKIARVRLQRKDLRVPFPAQMPRLLEGATIRAIGRRAKYLLFYLDSGDVLIAHLGMSGRFSVMPPPAQYQAHDHVIIALSDGRELVYNDARRFGLMALTREDGLSAHKLLAHLGPEPLEGAFTGDYLRHRLARHKTPVKTALMDQTLVVGVGNIYASEALFLAGIDPRKPACGAAVAAVELVAAIRQVLGDAIASGGSSLRDFVHVSGEAGYFQHRFQVYGRAGKPCVTCETPVVTMRQAGRSSFYCPSCQV